MRRGAAAVAFFFFGCGSVGGLGDRCTTSGECGTDRQCIFVDEPNAYCLGEPIRPEPLTCSDDEDCTLAEVGRYPIEAQCGEEGTCTCAGTDFLCPSGSVLVDASRCSCKVAGGSGDPCSTRDDCGRDLACDNAVCTQFGTPGAECRDGETGCDTGLTCTAGLCTL